MRKMVIRVKVREQATETPTRTDVFKSDGEELDGG